MRILVTGGAGYIGSHTVVELARAGHDVAIVDSFANAKPSVVDRIGQIVGRPIRADAVDLCDSDELDRLFASERWDAVMHFAALKSVSDSLTNPLAYYQTNVGGTLNLLSTMRTHGVRNLVFSSSATVYDPTSSSPVLEAAPLRATNPYGWSKIGVERVLRSLVESDDGWHVGVLRYFNPVGAHSSGLIGEDPARTPANLMPILVRVAAGLLPALQVYGSDYPTPDGTGIRDFIHVEDLAEGHIAALNRICKSGQRLGTWNLGTGHGTSVLQLLRTFEQVTGRRVPYELSPRRPGDVAKCYADPGLAQVELGWRANRSVAAMCMDAWRFADQQTAYS